MVWLVGRSRLDGAGGEDVAALLAGVAGLAACWMVCPAWFVLCSAVWVPVGVAGGTAGKAGAGAPALWGQVGLRAQPSGPALAPSTLSRARLTAAARLSRSVAIRSRPRVRALRAPHIRRIR
ncbi:hypothetical protein BH24ACT15_BH24ACT15_32860 [soil metagenome]